MSEDYIPYDRFPPIPPINLPRTGESRTGVEGADFWVETNFIPKTDKVNRPASYMAATHKTDEVNHPSHYTAGGVECIDAIQAALTPEEFRGFLKGNIMKYTWRERIKGGIESVKKAAWYLEKLIRVTV